jgi:TonB family protein
MIARRVFLMMMLGAGTANGEPAGDDTRYVEGKSYEQDGLKWSDKLARFSPHKLLCEEAGGKCTFDSLVIRNDSDVDLRCAISLNYPQPNKGNVANLAGMEIIVKGSERETTRVMPVPAKLKPVSFSSQCSAAPEPPPLTTPAECKATIKRLMDPGLFYPPGAKRRNEQGPVTVEFTVAEAMGPPSDIAIARSSEHADLDTAARKLAATMVLETNCPGQRFRKVIPFLLTSS